MICTNNEIMHVAFVQVLSFLKTDDVPFCFSFGTGHYVKLVKINRTIFVGYEKML